MFSNNYFSIYYIFQIFLKELIVLFVIYTRYIQDFKSLRYIQGFSICIMREFYHGIFFITDLTLFNKVVFHHHNNYNFLDPNIYILKNQILNIYFLIIAKHFIDYIGTSIIDKILQPFANSI